jgi:hypothetical protein
VWDSLHAKVLASVNLKAKGGVDMCTDLPLHSKYDVLTMNTYGIDSQENKTSLQEKKPSSGAPGCATTTTPLVSVNSGAPSGAPLVIHIPVAHAPLLTLQCATPNLPWCATTSS